MKRWKCNLFFISSFSVANSQVPDPPNYSYDPIDYDSAYGDYDYYRDNPAAIGIAPRAGFGKVIKANNL